MSRLSGLSDSSLRPKARNVKRPPFSLHRAILKIRVPRSRVYGKHKCQNRKSGRVCGDTSQDRYGADGCGEVYTPIAQWEFTHPADESNGTSILPVV